MLHLHFCSYDEAEGEAEDSDAEEEVNGNEDDSVVDSSSEEEEDLDESVGLGAVYSENLDDLSDEGDYEAAEEEEEEDGIEEEEDEDGTEEDAQSPASSSPDCEYRFYRLTLLIFVFNAIIWDQHFAIYIFLFFY